MFNYDSRCTNPKGSLNYVNYKDIGKKRKKNKILIKKTQDSTLKTIKY